MFPESGMTDPWEEDRFSGEEEYEDERGESHSRRARRRRRRKKTSGMGSTKLPACAVLADKPPSFYYDGMYGVRLMRRPLVAMGWTRASHKTDEHVRLKWVHNYHRIDYSTFREGKQMLKHIPNCHLLTNKLELLRSLQDYEQVTLFTKGRLPRFKMKDFVPETYKLDERPDRITFLNTYQDGEMWVCKPARLDRGRGITLLRSRDDIDALLAGGEGDKSIRPRIIQRYITSPLLLDGRKFDIRNYMLIASTAPFLVLFHHGFVRLSCLKYDVNDNNPTMHLTNQAVQKKVSNFKDVKDETVWSMEKLNEYINAHVAPGKNMEEDWVFTTLTKQMRRIMLRCFKSVKQKLERRIGYFDFYGFDFMIDANLKVWLLEINLNPSLGVGCEVLKEVKQRFMEETLHLAIEAFEKSRRNQPLMPLKSLKNCVVLHCDSASFRRAKRKSRTVSTVRSKSAGRTRNSETCRKFSPSTSLPRLGVAASKASPYASSGWQHYTHTALPTLLKRYIDNGDRQQ